MIIVGVGLLALGLSRRDWRLSTWGAVAGAVGLTLALTNYAHWAVVTAHNDTVVLGHQNPPVVVRGRGRPSPAAAGSAWMPSSPRCETW